MPAVEYKGKALYESLILCEFLEDAFPDHKPNLLPSDPVQRAVARLWLDHLTKTFIPAFYRLLQAQEAEKQHDALQEIYESLRKFAENIQGPYFFGESFSLVDVAIAPWIVRDYVIEENRGYKRGDICSSWRNYAEIVEVRNSVVRTQSVSIFFFFTSSKNWRIVNHLADSQKSMWWRCLGVFCAMRHRVKLLRPFVLEELSLEGTVLKT